MSARWVSYEAVKEAVSMRAVLEAWGVKGLRRSGRHQYRGRCPLHGGQGRDAFHAQLERNVFHCFRCQAGGNVLDLVAALEKCTVREAALCLQDRFVGATGPNVVAAERNGGERRKLVTKKIRDAPQARNAALGFTLRPLDTTHPYPARRGITAETTARFGIGYYAGAGILHGRLVIPIHDEAGTLVAYCGRALDGASPRYRFPARFIKSAVLFNLHRATASGAAEVIVVEGFFDCMRVHQAGLPAVVALMGVILSSRQQELLLSRFRKVSLLLDGDAAGQTASCDLAARLHPHCELREMLVPPGCQPDGLSEGEIQKYFSTEK